jgi:hypothetical protein
MMNPPSTPPERMTWMVVLGCSAYFGQAEQLASHHLAAADGAM